jgi:hypothetical protein
MNPAAHRYRLIRAFSLATALLAAGCFVDFPTGSGPDANPECGNGTAEPGESCDGADLAGRTCQSLGLGPGVLTCRSDCSGFDTAGCGLPGCGNGVQEGNEACDGADLAGATCASIGYGPGQLACQANCVSFDTTGCARLNDGDPCTENDQCLGGECWTETVYGWPAGYCTGDCESGPCVGGGVCVHHLSAGIHLCHKSCADSAVCRQGYACFVWFQGEPPACWAHCTSNDECPQTQFCNPWRGLCGVEVEGEVNGATCTEGARCRGFLCRTDLPGGYCVSNCSLHHLRCPDDGVCVDVYNGTMGDLGQCMDGCTTINECRAGYDCTGSAPGQYCMPP